MKNFIYISLCLLFITVNAFAENKMTEEEKQQALKIADPLLDEILAAYNANDHNGYIKNFSTPVKKIITETFFKQTVQGMIGGTIGKYVSRKVHNVERFQGGVKIEYMAKFEKEDKIKTIAVLAQEKGKNVIASLNFDSIKLRQIVGIKELTGKEKASFLKRAEPIVENLLYGYNNALYEVYSKDFSDNLKKYLTKDTFPKIHTFVHARIGNYQSKTAGQVFVKQGAVTINYIAKFAKAKQVIMSVTFVKSKTEVQVARVFFSSPELQK